MELLLRLNSNADQTNSALPDRDRARKKSMTWHTRDPERLRKEVELMQHHSKAALHRVAGRLAWLERIHSSASGRPYDLAIEYPDTFPYSPPRAFILSPSVEGAPHRLSDGSLCLFGDPWQASGVKTTALSVRNRAIVWFLAFEVWQRTGEWCAPAH
jgi:hypothetical protein